MNIYLNKTKELVIHFDNKQERRAVLALSRTTDCMVDRIADIPLTDNCIGQMKNFLRQVKWCLLAENRPAKEDRAFENFAFKDSYNNQELLDIMIAITMKVHTHKYFKDKNCNEIGNYIREQLNKCDIKTIPIGSSHAVLIRKNK